MKHRLYVTVLLLLPVAGASAQDTGLNFLRIGANAMASAMGDAQVAASRDAFSTYWNPAGLAASGNAVGASHRLWVGDVKAYDIAVRLPSRTGGAWGLALTATDSGDLEAREVPGEPAGLFSAQFISIGVSYARSYRALRGGITTKFLRESIYNASASGYAFDVGLQLDAFRELVTLGAALRNAGRMNELEAERTQLPRVFQAGAAVFPFQVIAGADGTRLLQLMLTAEVSHLFANEVTRLHGGLSATVMEMVDLRGGYVTRDELRDFTFGLGLNFDTMLVDYAYIPFEEGFEGPGHVLSILYTW